jgi:cytochrome c-type biogenesis protein CcmH/NrfG
VLDPRDDGVAMEGDASSAASGGRLAPALVYAGLLVLVLAIYARTAGYDFVYYDDPDYVTANAMVREGLTLHGLRWALTSTEAANWHPVTWASHMLDVELFGLQPGAHHLVNVVLHLVNACLLFELLRRMTGALGPSAAVALLFAVHPMHVESVAWVAERKDVLSAAFFLAALLAYEAWVRRRGTLRYLLVTGLFGLGSMAKPMVVTLPLVMLLLDAWPLSRDPSAPDRSRVRVWAGLVTEKLPWLAMSAAACVLTVVAQHGGGSLESTYAVPLPLRVANAVVSYVRYLGKLAWPVNLTVAYPHPNLAGGTPWTVFEVGASIAAMAVLTTLALGIGRRRRYVAVGWLWYGIMLAPVIGVVQVGQQAMADRYTYLPYVGLFLVVAWGARDVVEALGVSSRIRAVAGAAALALVLALSVQARNQVLQWRNTESLFRHAIAVSAPTPVVLTNLGVVLAEQGRLDEAIEMHRVALHLAPDDAQALNNLGLALHLAGRLDEAIANYRMAVTLDPHRVSARHNLATALRDSGRLDEAIAEYRRALEIDPGAAKTRVGLEQALRRQAASRPSGGSL